MVTQQRHDPGYQLVWPRALFVAQASRLLNERRDSQWDDSCHLLLADAFVANRPAGPVSDCEQLEPTAEGGGAGLSERQRFLKELMDAASELWEDSPPRRPYWRERRGVAPVVALTPDAVVAEFIDLIRELTGASCFDRAFGDSCIDGGEWMASEVLEDELGEAHLWPLDQRRLQADIDLFYTVVEALHDCVARPRKALYYHRFCESWHRSGPDAGVGQTVYRWRINKIFDRSDAGIRMATEGDDIGRLVRSTDEARSDLIRAVSLRTAGSDTNDQVRHAVALFRERGADRHQKRSAIVALGLILEERRHGTLTTAMARKDAGALFDIANNFNIRHQNADQKTDYPDDYLDWIFWIYLASIELTSRVLELENSTGIPDKK